MDDLPLRFNAPPANQTGFEQIGPPLSPSVYRDQETDRDSQPDVAKHYGVAGDQAHECRGIADFLQTDFRLAPLGEWQLSPHPEKGVVDAGHHQSGLICCTCWSKRNLAAIVSPTDALRPRQFGVRVCKRGTRISRVA
jgi:hypothetical protein